MVVRYTTTAVIHSTCRRCHILTSLPVPSLSRIQLETEGNAGTNGAIIFMEWQGFMIKSALDLHPDQLFLP